jgi:hypothetical protein
LHVFARSAYVGYTATPFANIFIHERGETREEGPDLFPSAFIVNLAAPSNYVGPTAVFGRRANEGREGGLPLIRHISDYASEDLLSGWMPPKHRKEHVPRFQGSDAMPTSLIEAIDSFVLACTVRCLRGQESKHMSMLVHVTRFNAVQGVVFSQVSEYVRQVQQRLMRRIGHEGIVGRLKALYETSFFTTNASIREDKPELDTMPLPAWDAVLVSLPEAVQDIKVRMINGTARDALDYADCEATGLKVIAIGGDKLSRGLTLEGLCTSYFLRASRMYDTLMQMGRWFGYRPGYLDLCRLYTTTELSGWFGHITDASDELREEFDLMVASGATPREYGLKVQSHPVLMVTSQLKMRRAHNLLITFSGQLLETVALYRDPNVLNRNLDAARRLIAACGGPSERNPKQIRNGSVQEWDGYLWRDVPSVDVVDFLNNYKTHPEAKKVNSAMLAEFIESMSGRGELTTWTVALIGGGRGTKCNLANDIAVDMLQRTNNGPHDDRYSIGRLLSPRDEFIDTDEETWNAALEVARAAWRDDPARMRVEAAPDTPNGLTVRFVQGGLVPGISGRPDRGLLLLYVLDPQKAGEGFLPAGTPEVVAFGICFPGSNSGTKVVYKVNNVLWEQEYGPAD